MEPHRSDTELDALLLKATGASRIASREHVQTLWSGYGRIERLRFDGMLASSAKMSVVLKVVDPGAASEGHPRGWDGNTSHRRKLRSYEVEQTFYKRFASRSRARVPALTATSTPGGPRWMLLEDLDAAGFSRRTLAPDSIAIGACLRWLATFHASFLDTSPAGLWATGTYWHLATRPDELRAMEPGSLFDAAGWIDAALDSCTHSTLVHGDAKIANFCLSARGSEVAAVDFQYVGGGAGIKDVVYFLGSCAGAADEEHSHQRWVDVYFEALRAELQQRGVNADPVEEEWRTLHDLACADFHRFLAGWAPDHWKRDGYGRQATARAISAWHASGSPKVQ